MPLLPLLLLLLRLLQVIEGGCIAQQLMHLLLLGSNCSCFPLLLLLLGSIGGCLMQHLLQHLLLAVVLGRIHACHQSQNVQHTHRLSIKLAPGQRR